MAYANRLVVGLLGLGLMMPKMADGQRVANEERRPAAEAAKKAQMARRVAVTIAIVDSLDAPSSIRALVVRNSAGTGPRDMILLRRATTGAELSAAVFHLMTMRERGGDTATSSATYRVPPVPAGSQRPVMPNADRIVLRLQGAVPRTLAGYGSARTTEVYLPSKAMRDAARDQSKPGRSG